MRLVGIDENGYGPILGPLVVTAASAKLKENAIREPEGSNPVPNLWSLLKIKDTPGDTLFVCDSKEAFTSNKKGYAEDLVLTFFFLTFGFLPETADQFLKPLLINQRLGLPFPCSKEGTPPFCWQNDLDLKIDSARRKLILKNASNLKKMAERADVKFEKPCSLLLCPRLFNEGVERTHNNKSDLVITLGLQILSLYLVEKNLYAFIGKVGMTKSYGQRLSHFLERRYLVWTIEEKKEASRYQLYETTGREVGQVTYLLAGEKNSFLIALASLFGKYLRELFWKKTQKYFEELDPQLPGASGYRNLKTRTFISATERLRKELLFPQGCFLRKK